MVEDRMLSLMPGMDVAEQILAASRQRQVLDCGGGPSDRLTIDAPRKLIFANRP